MENKMKTLSSYCLVCMLLFCIFDNSYANNNIAGKKSKILTPEAKSLIDIMSVKAGLVTRMTGGKIKFTNNEYNDIYLLGTSYSAKTNISNIQECNVDPDKFVIIFKKPFVAESPVSLFPLIYSSNFLSEYYLYNDSDVTLTHSDKEKLKEVITELRQYVTQYQQMVYDY